MKTIKYAVAAVALSTLSFGVFAAEPVTAAQAQSMSKIGVVSAEGATTLDGTEAKLAESRCRWRERLQHHLCQQQQQNERYCCYLQISFTPSAANRHPAPTLIEPELPLFARPPLDGLFIWRAKNCRSPAPVLPRVLPLLPLPTGNRPSGFSTMPVPVRFPPGSVLSSARSSQDPSAAGSGTGSSGISLCRFCNTREPVLSIRLICGQRCGLA